MATPGNNGKHSHRHVLAVLVENHFGVLAKISGLFGMRGFNIDSLAVGETHDPTISRITLVTTGDDRIVGQIIQQLNKLVEVIKVQDMTHDPHVECELMLVKVNASTERRAELIQIVDIFKAKIRDLSPDTVTVEIVGTEDKLESFTSLMRPFGIAELARTGRVALNRGDIGLQSGFLREESENHAGAKA